MIAVTRATRLVAPNWNGRASETLVRMSSVLRTARLSKNKIKTTPSARPVPAMICSARVIAGREYSSTATARMTANTASTPSARFVSAAT